MSTRPTIELRRVSRCSGGSWDAAHVTADRMQGGRVLPQLSASSAPDTAPRNNERAGLATDLHRSPPITLRQIRESQPRLLSGGRAPAGGFGVAAAAGGGRPW